MKTTIGTSDKLIRAANLRALSQDQMPPDLVGKYPRQGLEITEKCTVDLPSCTSVVALNARGFPQVKCLLVSTWQTVSLSTLLEIERSTLEVEDARRCGLPV